MKRQKLDDRELLRRVVDEAYSKPTWNGTNLRSSISRLGVDKASWVPPDAKHSIADITLHCAYWKYAIARKLRGGKRGGFPRKGTNWFESSKLNPKAWSELRELLDQQHEALCSAISESPKLLRYADTSMRPIVRKIFGVAIHDAYHTGQVHLILAQFRRSHRR